MGGPTSLFPRQVLKKGGKAKNLEPIEPLGTRWDRGSILNLSPRSLGHKWDNSFKLTLVKRRLSLWEIWVSSLSNRNPTKISLSKKSSWSAHLLKRLVSSVSFKHSWIQGPKWCCRYFPSISMLSLSWGWDGTSGCSSLSNYRAKRLCLLTAISKTSQNGVPLVLTGPCVPS